MIAGYILGLCAAVALGWFIIVTILILAMKKLGRELERTEVKRKLVMSAVVLSAVVVIFLLLSITTNAYPGLTGQSLDEQGGGKIHTLNGDAKKGIKEIFSSKKNMQGGEDDAIKKKAKEYLHFDWMDDGLSYRKYGQKIASLYGIVPYRKDESMEEQNAEELQEIAKYKNIINEIDAKRQREEWVEEADLQCEAEAYWNSFQIRPVARMAYQAGRAYEDVFWYQESSGKDSMEAAAHAIHSFETFLQFENREIGKAQGQEQKDSILEGILFRNGKTCFQLSVHAEDKSEELHYLFMAYGFFANVNLKGVDVLNGKIGNEYILLAEYYKGLVITNLPGDQIDEILHEELNNSLYISRELLERNAKVSQGLKQNEEENMSKLLEDLETSIQRVEKWGM